MDGEASWWTISENIGLPPLSREWVHNNKVVDGETYGCLKRFCYLEDTSDGDGGADLAATARIRNGWMNEVPRAFAISDIQSSPNRDAMLSVCQLCHKQHDLWK